VGRGAAARQKPTKEAIAAKWATVTTATSLYVEEPSVSAPYKAGELTDNILESGLTYFNYIRFVAGLPEVTLDETLTGDAQHGAVLLAALNQLSHTPPKPADMDSPFYKRGYGATSSANISARWGYAPLTCLQHSIQGCLDDNGDNIYIELVRFDAYTLPNEALNSGEIDLNSFQHYAYLNKEIESQGYDLTVIGDTNMAPLTLYSRKYDSLDALKEAAGKKE
jgi:hypothetical protein